MNVEDPEARYNLGLVKAQMRQLDEAYELLAPFKDVNSAIMALSVNQNEEAAAIMESVRSNSPQCEYVRAMVSARLEEDADALGHIAKAAEDVALRERAKIEYDFKPSFNEKIGIIAKLDVNYVTKIYQFNPQLFSGKLMLLSVIINNNYLYNEVRIKNGAYGVTSYANQYGQFNFRSFHDPNIKKTLDVYDETSNFISNLALTDAELTNQIISTIGNIEQPSHVKTISEVALNRYLAKRGNDYYLSIRNDIINAKLNDLHNLANVISDKANYVVFGSEEEINKNSDLFTEIIKF